ncbi:hypothetical protein PPYR_14544 [Photinus pyralis]|uniref:Odorant receptor n=1 Tax=Photinus pyralis TaxID=7054 RepID=A0A5N4A5I5_PHOPY|nr:uncharacterized protein LOC116181136 [Photinus pyralis]KAB0792585.1 hypothetical protein PPYR_14544 [Photinus pyralis]
MPQEYYFSPVRKYSKLSGLFLNKDVSKYESMISVAIMCYFYIFVVCKILVFFEDVGVSNNMQDIVVFFVFTNVIPHSTIIRLKRLDLVELMRMAEEIYVCESDALNAFYEKMNKQAALVQKLVCPFGIGVVVLAFLMWFVTGNEDPLPFGLMPSWAMSYSLIGCAFWEVLTSLFLSHEYTICMGIKLCVLVHLYEHFTHLKAEIQSLDEDCRERRSDSHYLQNRLASISRYHASIRALAQKADATFNLCLLSIYLNWSIFICTCLLRIGYIQLFSGEFWYLVIYLSAGCSLLFGDCFSTQRVINESETVGDACYQIDSVGCDLQFQKSLTMVIKEGQEPVVFTIEKFGNFSVGSIQIILKASFSYYTFLRSFS